MKRENVARLRMAEAALIPGTPIFGCPICWDPWESEPSCEHYDWSEQLLDYADCSFCGASSEAGSEFIVHMADCHRRPLPPAVINMTCPHCTQTDPPECWVCADDPAATEEA